MNNDAHNQTGGTAGFVLYVAIMTILAAGAVGGVLLYAAYNHSKAVQRWHDADQCLLDAQSALEQVKYEMIQAYGSNSPSAVSWFLNWSSNAIGTTPVYNIPAPLTVKGTPVFVTLAGVTVITNAGAKLVTLTLRADARKSADWPVCRKIQEQMRLSVGTATGGAPVSANCAFGLYGSNANVTVSGRLNINGNNWSLPPSFNSGSGSQSSPSTNDLPGVAYTSSGLATGNKVSILGTPPQTSQVGAYDAAYWYQFLDVITPAATLYAGGSLGTRAAPVITKLPSGATTFDSAQSGAGILIVPLDATLAINQNFYYEGLVLVLADNTSNRELKQNLTSTIYGSLICLGDNFRMKVSGTFDIRYSRQAITNLAKITANLPFASSGGSNGVPYTSHWREIH